MTPTFRATEQHRLEVVPGGGPVVAQRVLVPEGTDEGSHLLSWRVAGVWTSAGVEAVACPQVPPGVVAITDELAALLDLDPTRCTDWRLDRKPSVRASSITLEQATEGEPREVADKIGRSALVGQLLWLPPDGREMWLSVDGVPHRVHEVDAGGKTGVIAELTAATKVELYAPVARAGVDIVVLADGSGSMAVDDLPRTGRRAAAPGGPPGWVKRINALRDALNDLLTMRLQTAGRTSQIALLEFAETVSHRFPKQGGMAQLDADSPVQVADEFRSAVTLLKTAGPRTHIGNALHEAANLLYQYGKPGNDRLVVLVSDGADWWHPQGDDGTGEVVYAAEEPVSLMAHLHRDMGIKLHAVGISTEDLFRRRGTFEMRESLIPNHTLLQELVKVGGGDPTTIGGIDALESYFSGLGSGVVHRVAETPRRLPSARGPLLDATLAALRRLAGPEHDWDRERVGLHHEVGALVGECVGHAQRVLGRLPWAPTHWQRSVPRDCGRTVGDDRELIGFLVGISGAFAPEADVDGVWALTPWAALMDDLRQAAAGGAPDYDRLSRACGAVVHAAAQAQVAVLRRVRAGLADLRDELAARVPAAKDDGPGRYELRYLD